jgi:RHS repeat-associated protein
MLTLRESRDGRYSWARYYHPGLQRFISDDPIGFAGGDPNLYAYVINSPTILTDATGELANVAVGALLGGAVGALKAVYAGCGLSGIAEGAIKGTIVGTVAGATFGAGLPLLSAAGITGLAIFDVEIMSENLKGLVGRKPRPARDVILSSVSTAFVGAAVAAGTGGVGRLAADVAADVSPGFAVGVGRFFSTGLGSANAIFIGPVAGCR